MLSDDEFGFLLDQLGRPRAGYRKVRKGVKKRLRRHMLALGCSTVDRYLAQLALDPGARAVCDDCLRVTISRFFRDRQLWQILQARILPALAEYVIPPVRIWSAGCAGGEEPYSVAMLWQEMARPAALTLLATDAAVACLDRARAGIYTRSSFRELPEAIRKKYFTAKKNGRQFIVRSRRLPSIHWWRHDLLDPPPGDEPFHMILLRNNLLTYYLGAQQHDAFVRVVSSLAQGGFLVTGAHERLPDSELTLVREKDCPWLYRLA